MRNERSRSNLSAFPGGLIGLSCSVRKRVCDEHYQQYDEFKAKVLCYLKRYPAPLHFLYLKDMTVCKSHLLVYKLIPEVEHVQDCPGKKKARNMLEC